RKPESAAQQKPPRHGALGPLLGLGALDRPARLLVDGLDAVDFAAQRDQLLLRHRGQRRLVGLQGAAALVGVVAHEDRAPIHTASPRAATIPMSQKAMPSGAGPNPPRP